MSKCGTTVQFAGQRPAPALRLVITTGSKSPATWDLPSLAQSLGEDGKEWQIPAGFPFYGWITWLAPEQGGREAERTQHRRNKTGPVHLARRNDK
jgi:hypothetical protein